MSTQNWSSKKLTNVFHGHTSSVAGLNADRRSGKRRRDGEAIDRSQGNKNKGGNRLHFDFNLWWIQQNQFYESTIAAITTAAVNKDQLVVVASEAVASVK